MAKWLKTGWVLGACFLQVGACKVMTDVDRDLIPFGGAAGVTGTAGAPGSGGTGTGGDSCELPTEFRWTSTGPLIGPISDADHDLVSIKDPTVVRFEDRWHIYATTATRADEEGGSSWSLVYLSFSDWAHAGSAEQIYIDVNEDLRGYHAAPQLFYFTDQDSWYLIFQSPAPQFSTTTDISDPSSWSAPESFFSASMGSFFEDTPDEERPNPWIDFWVICDETHCYLFFTGDNGKFYRSRTARDDFPQGMSDPELVMEVPFEDRYSLWEGSATYKLKGEDRYLTIIEAMGGPAGARYYRSFVADTLDGEWTPLADTWQNPFAGPSNVVSYDDLPSAGGAGGAVPGDAGASATAGAAGSLAATAGGAAGNGGAVGAGGEGGAASVADGGQAGAPSGGGGIGSAGAPASAAGADGQSGAAGAAQVPWTQDISHGELLRDGYDETMTIDACNLQLLYQGRAPQSDTGDYSQLPYRLGLLTLAPAEEPEPEE